MTLEQVREAKDAVRLGDTVRITGTWCLHSGVLAARTVHVLERWADMHPGKSFLPWPLPAACRYSAPDHTDKVAGELCCCQHAGVLRAGSGSQALQCRPTAGVQVLDQSADLRKRRGLQVPAPCRA